MNSISIKPKCKLADWNEVSLLLEKAGLNPLDFVNCSQVGFLKFHLIQNSIGGDKKLKEIIPENYL